MDLDPEDGEVLNPQQQRVLAELLQPPGPRPEYPEDLSRRLRTVLEDGLADKAGLLETAGQKVFANKGKITQILQCERHHQLADAFEWTVSSARGTVAHRAIQLGFFDQSSTAPMHLTDAAIDLLINEGGDYSPGDWLAHSSPAEKALLRAEVTELVTSFQDCFPPLKPAWRPRIESAVTVNLFRDAVTLRAKVDMALGRPSGRQARALFIDIKSGNPYAAHADELRFYALLEAIKIGVPPFRVATFYVSSGEWAVETVDEEMLELAARRVIGAVGRLIDLQVGTREATIAPGPQCGWCSERDVCTGAVRWREDRERYGLVDDLA